MTTLLSEIEIDSIARRVVQLMGERLTVPVAQPPVQAPEPDRRQNQGPQKLAYTVAELSDELGLSRVSIYRLEVRGLLKPVPGIRKKLYARTEVEKFLAGKQGGWALRDK